MTSAVKPDMRRSEPPLLVRQLQICADFAKDSVDGRAHLNPYGRLMLKQAADTIVDMLAALKEIEREDHDEDANQGPYSKIARAAIAKAEGR